MNQEKALCPNCNELALVFTADELGEFYICENCGHGE